MTTADKPTERVPLKQRLAGNADGILEQIAREYGVSTYDVVAALPEEHRTVVDGAKFSEIMTALTGWGEVLMIVHTPDIVLECAGSIPPGTEGRGYFNLHGDSPIGGHIKAENCRHIVFVSRPFMGRASRSLQFFNAAGEAMFKVFVRRDAKRELIPAQVAQFDALRSSYAAGKTGARLAS
ncbi:MAG: heme utilization cystosolic carrier protein HutX [Hyphomicrobiaceae bacterium]|mgnify:CR=1 FL=1|jgi:putative heme utilization carrier protein HutX